MSFPIEIIIGSERINVHALFEILAYFIGYRYFIQLRNQDGDQLSNHDASADDFGGSEPRPHL